MDEDPGVSGEQHLPDLIQDTKRELELFGQRMEERQRFLWSLPAIGALIGSGLLLGVVSQVWASDRPWLAWTGVVVFAGAALALVFRIEVEKRRQERRRREALGRDRERPFAR